MSENGRYSNLTRVTVVGVGILFLSGLIYGRQIVGMATGLDDPIAGSNDLEEPVFEDDNFVSEELHRVQPSAKVASQRLADSPTKGPKCPSGTHPAQCLEQVLKTAAKQMGHPWAPTVGNCQSPSGLSVATNMVKIAIESGYFRMWTPDPGSGKSTFIDQYKTGYNELEPAHLESMNVVTNQMASLAVGGHICPVQWGTEHENFVSIGIVSKENEAFETSFSYGFASQIGELPNSQIMENGFGTDVCTFNVEVACRTVAGKSECVEALCDSTDIFWWQAGVECSSPTGEENVGCQMKWEAACASGGKMVVMADPGERGRAHVSFEGHFGSTQTKVGYASCDYN